MKRKVVCRFRRVKLVTQYLKYISGYSGSLTSDSSGELHVLWHDGNSLGVDGTEVGVLEESNHVGLSSLLEGEDGR